MDNFKIHLVDFRQGFFVDYLFDRSEFCDFAVSKSTDVIGIKCCIVDFVQNQNNGFAELVTQTANSAHHIRRMVNIQIISGLVQKNILRILCDYHRNVSTLALTAG